MIVGLLAGMLALDTAAGLAGCELLETCGRYAVQFRVLPSVSDHLIGVGADEVAFQTVEVRCFVLHRAEGGSVGALDPSAGNVGSVLLEIATHQGVQTFVSSRVLDETCFVAEGVAAVLAHTVEMSLVFPVPAVGVPAVLVESEPVMNKRNDIVTVKRLRILRIIRRKT